MTPLDGTDPASDTSSGQPRGTGALLRQRTFGLWFAGNLANNSGTWLYNVAAVVVVYNLTRSAFQVGLVTMAQYIPMVVLAPWAGALSDRIDRRRLALASQAFSAASATALAVTVTITGADGLPGAWPVILASLGVGTGLAFSGPPLQALVPALVDDVDLDMAVTLTSLTYNLGRAFGPATAGVLLATLGAEMAFAVNALSFLALIAVLAVIRPRDVRSIGHDGSARAGLAYVREDGVALRLLVGIGAIGFAADPINTLAPALADVAGGDGRLVAWLVSAFGVAAGTTVLLSARLYRRFGVATAGSAGGVVLATGLAVAASAPRPQVALLGFAVMGSGYVLGVNSFTALLQRRTPEYLRGRVMALWTMAFLGSRPLAALVHGSAADLLGVRLAFLAALSMALVAAVATRRVGRA